MNTALWFVLCGALLVGTLTWMVRHERALCHPEAQALMASGEAIDQLRGAVMMLDYRLRYQERNRLSLLSVHGAGGLATTYLIFKDAPAAAVVATMGMQGSFWFNVLPALGGAILLAGLYSGRKLFLESFGMTTILAWDVGMMYVYSKVSPSLPEPGPTYPTAIYATLAGLLIVHLATLIGMLLEGRRAR